MITATRRLTQSPTWLEYQRRRYTLQEIGDMVGLTGERIRQALIEQGVTVKRIVAKPTTVKKNGLPLAHRVISRIDTEGNGCWEWQGYCDPGGYGRINVGGEVTYVHRLVMNLWGGGIPEGLQALHKCNNPACCRPGPGHIYIGTPKDNMKDRDIRMGRRDAD